MTEADSFVFVTLTTRQIKKRTVSLPGRTGRIYLHGEQMGEEGGSVDPLLVWFLLYSTYYVLILYFTYLTKQTQTEIRKERPD